jgi:hypothetical protein
MLIKVMSNYLKQNKHPKWAGDYRLYEAVRKAITSLDDLEYAMNAKWQEGRLRLLCEVSLREKFDRQRDKVVAALQQDDGAVVLEQCKRMSRAWAALDAAASASKAPLKPHWIEFPMPTGEILTILHSALQVSVLPPTKHGRIVYTIDQLAKLISERPDEFRSSWAREMGRVAQSASKTLQDPEAICNEPFHDDPIPF